MATYKQIWSFQGPDGEQWTESWWTVASSTFQAAQVGSLILNDRLALLSNNCKWLSTKSVNSTNNRDTYIQPIGASGSNVVSALAGEPVDLAAVISLRTAGNKRRRWWLRGLNSANYVVGFNGIHQLSGTYASLVSQFLNDMITNQYGVVALTPLRLIPPFVAYITAIDGSARNGLTLISTATAHGLVAGNDALIYRVNQKDFPRLRGHFSVVTAPSVTTFTVPYSTPGNIGPAAGSGFVRLQTYAAIDGFAAPGVFGTLPAGWQLLHIGHHDTKESVFGSRGARRVQRTRLLP